MKIQPLKKHLSKKWVIITLATVVVIGGAAGAYFYYQANQYSASQSGQSARPINSVDYSAPTEEEAAAGDEQKEENKKREDLDNTPAASSADIVVTDASQYGDDIEVRAYITNIYEDGGTCTAIFSMAGQTDIKISHTAFKDAKTTQCGALDAKRPQFTAPGTWSVKVNYESNTAQGNSASRNITIK